MRRKHPVEKKPEKKSRFGVQLELFSREAELNREILQRKNEPVVIVPGDPFADLKDDLPW